jgi:hypothetical protein
MCLMCNFRFGGLAAATYAATNSLDMTTEMYAETFEHLQYTTQLYLER